MGEERQRILRMLSEGKISVAEAESLLDAVEPTAGDVPAVESGEATGPVKPRRPKYLRIQVEDLNEEGRGERVNIRVPLALLRAGLKLSNLMPKDALQKVHDVIDEKGIKLDLTDDKSGTADELIHHLAELTVDVDDRGERVRVFCE